MDDRLPPDAEFPVPGERAGVVSTTGRWDGGRHYRAVCRQCEWRSEQMTRVKAREAVGEHVRTREHWMWRTRIFPRPKRLTGLHWEEIRKIDPYDSRLRLDRGGHYDRLDRQAEQNGYERGDGIGRPWFRQHLVNLLAVTLDPEAFAVYQRLEEIARAEQEKPALEEALREWRSVVELVAAVRGDI